MSSTKIFIRDNVMGITVTVVCLIGFFSLSYFVGNKSFNSTTHAPRAASLPPRSPIVSRDGGFELIPWSRDAVLANSTKPVVLYQEKELLLLSDAMIDWLKSAPESEKLNHRLGKDWKADAMAKFEKNHGVKLLQPTQGAIGAWEFNFSTKFLGLMTRQSNYGGTGLYFTNVRLENGQWIYDELEPLFYVF